jgi:hypothetical protein
VFRVRILSSLSKIQRNLQKKVKYFLQILSVFNWPPGSKRNIYESGTLAAILNLFKQIGILLDPLKSFTDSLFVAYSAPRTKKASEMYANVLRFVRTAFILKKKRPSGRLVQFMFSKRSPPRCKVLKSAKGNRPTFCQSIC